MFYGLGSRPEIEIFLKEWRIYAGLSQAELARMTELSPPQISRLESGQRLPDLIFLKRFQQIVDCGHYLEPLVNRPDPTGVLLDLDMQRRFADLVEVVRNSIEAKLQEPKKGRPFD